MSEPTLAYRTCPLCEATCGLEITVSNGEVGRIRGDLQDVFSHGFICPKGSTLGKLHNDPDRLRRPVVKREGEFVEVSWDEAFAVIEARFLPIIADRGRDAVALYLGNPNTHNLSAGLYLRPLIKALATRNLFSASTVDQMPKHVSCGFMFGNPDLIPVPDIDRTDYLLMLGANPYESNGSLATAPDWPGRMQAIRERGGKVVVVDPRRTKTAEAADQHVALRPGTDAAFLLGLLHVLVDEGRIAPLPEHFGGLAEVGAAAAGFEPATVAPWCGVEEGVIRGIARELADAPTAVVYGRIGTHTTPFGTLASWLADVLNAVTGNLDAPGGAMFPLPAIATPRSKAGGRGFRVGRSQSRVSGHPEVRSELPVAALAEEIETAGPGQVRAMVTVAGNPVRSTPNSDRLEEALSSLEFMVSLDPYINETTRHADVILPPPSALERSHYDVAFYTLAVRNVANYSPAILSRPDDQPDEWETILRLAALLMEMETTPEKMSEAIVADQVQKAVANPASPAFGRDPVEVHEALAARSGPEKLLDLRLRSGPYGDGFGAKPDGLSLDTLEENPHGVDLGPLEPRLPLALETESGMVELAPDALLADIRRLADALSAGHDDGMLLVGRRHIRSNNSWMHNVEVLVKGKERCTLHIHPEDAAAAGVETGERVTVRSRVGELEVPVEVTEGIRPGVVSLPHGWGHDAEGSRLRVAAARPGANSNVLTDEAVIDPLSGNATLNGIPVHISAAG